MSSSTCQIANPIASPEGRLARPLETLSTGLHPSEAAPLGYRPALDGLRAVAVLVVLLVHAFPAQLPGGHMGVDIFFALSGFLITNLLAEEFRSSGTIRLGKFYMRRFLRLVPALLLLLTCYELTLYLECQAAGRPYPTRQHLFEFGQVAMYFSNWTRAFGYHPTGPLAHSWSLSIEEQYYLIWPLLLFFALLRYRRHAGRLVLVGVASALMASIWRGYLSFHASPERIYNGLDTRADILILGSCAGLAMHQYGTAISTWVQRHRRMVQAGLLLATLGMLPILFNVYWYDPLLGRLVLPLNAVLFPILVLVIVAAGDMPGLRWLTRPSLVFVGKISYGLYLWHFPLFMFWMPKLGLGQPWRLPVGVPLAFLCAWMSYRWLEVPVLRLKRRFSAWQPPVVNFDGPRRPQAQP